MTARITQGRPVSTAATAKNSLAENPANTGMPTMDSAATVKNTPASFARRPLPWIRGNSMLSPETSDSLGVVRKSSDFVTAWTRIWNRAAVNPASVPRPRPIKIYPICAAEEKATIRFRLPDRMAETEPAAIPSTPSSRRIVRIGSAT